MVEIRVAGKYRFTKKIGHGAFGDIFQGVNLKSNEDVAIKLVIKPIYLSTVSITESIGVNKCEVPTIAI